MQNFDIFDDVNDFLIIKNKMQINFSFETIWD
jgi:hypothetical protein